MTREAKSSDKLEASVDIFSLGCILAEMYLDGPLFDLSSMLQYRRGQYDVLLTLNAIEDTYIRV